MATSVFIHLSLYSPSTPPNIIQREQVLRCQHTRNTLLIKTKHIFLFLFSLVGLYKFDAAFLKFYIFYTLFYIIHNIFVVSTHWVGYVHNIYSSYIQHLTNKRQTTEKAPLEVRHNEGGSFLSASGFLCLLRTRTQTHVRLLLETLPAALLGRGSTRLVL